MGHVNIITAKLVLCVHSVSCSCATIKF